jgi:hypothetical protein
VTPGVVVVGGHVIAASVAYHVLNKNPALRVHNRP